MCGLKPPKSARDATGPPAPVTTGYGPNNGTSGGGSGGNGTTTEEVVITGWYPGWLASSVPPGSLSWDKWTHMTYSFALTGPDASNVVLNSDDQQVLPTFVAAAHQNGVKALVSIGGWTGSRFFSSAIATPENRTAFMGAVTKLANTYNLDGIDFDWEYPNKQGIGCNIISPSDSANFLAFLQQLRQDSTGSKLYLSAAVSIAPFMGPDGTPMSDVSEFSKYLNHIAIMNYDIWGSWSTGIGPNAPLDDSCAPTQAGSAKSAVAAWTGAKFPANQIVLGVASYGHSFKLSGQSNFSIYSPFTTNNNPLVPSDGSGGVDICGNPVTGGGGTDVYDFSQMVTAGFLSSDGTAASGINYVYDNCSQTPFVYNPNSGVVISYDDATSFTAKGKFINDNGMKGFAMWQVAGDEHDVLLDAISKAMDIQAVCS
ncbi:glycoside hydrolase family 18 protein [Macrolepiota fuliginosa MF-IS2]|uniref:Glycoside hydrolase family 18 protein n=1 Tax=Macrolepiota fuliginosa MF-IS2 TaxID=1400762 RepID=A0A9P5X756_9AGAR|nr:glycoside hydrolase family 18 protein [Macrolepiota fuliginosa MF-IS2]